MNIQKIVSGYASSNTYFISIDHQMIVIDPCLEIQNNPNKLLEKIEGYEVLAILLTHAHFDHISGVDAIVNKTKCPVYLTEKERDWPQNPQLNLSTMTPEIVSIKAKITPLNLGDLEIGPFKFNVVETPGHTKGSVSFIIDNHIFDGDFIFKDSVGRMDLPTGSEQDMKEAILSFIKSYGDKDYILYPGHGNKTTLQIEIKYNPFIDHYKAA